MNREKFAAVINHIENLPAGDKFNMGTWGRQTSCGTTACFAGWTVSLEDPVRFQELIYDYSVTNQFIKEAGEILGLELHEACQLFLPSSNIYTEAWEGKPYLAVIKRFYNGTLLLLSADDLAGENSTAGLVYREMTEEDF